MSKKSKAFQASCCHVRIQRKEFDPTTGKEKFPPFEQWFTPHEFKMFQENPNGHVILEILQDPTAKAEATNEEEAPKTARKR
jgi:hypothetical protein